MSSVPNNSQTRRMSSIARRLDGAWLRRRLGSIFLSSLLLLLLFPAYLAVREQAFYGNLTFSAVRSWERTSNEFGKMIQLTYCSHLPERSEELQVPLLPVRQLSPVQALLQQPNGQQRW